MYQTDCMVGKIIETGWIKGTAFGMGDVLQQYVSYTDVNGKFQSVFHLGNLNENTWYQMKVMYSSTASRWEAWRFNDVVWFAPQDLGWQRGACAATGSENNDNQGWMGVWGWHPEKRPDPGAWTLYNYDFSQTQGD